MRVLVIHAHPVVESFNAFLHERIVAVLRERGHEVDDCDLYAEAFQPALTRAERLAYHDVPDNLLGIERDVARLRWAEALVFCFPTWWYGMPAMLKGYFDRVWAPGVAFGLTPRGITPGLTHIRHMVVVTTHGSTHWFMRFHMREPGRAVLMRGLHPLLSPRARMQYLGHYGMNASTAARRLRFTARVERAMRRLPV